MGKLDSSGRLRKGTSSGGMCVNLVSVMCLLGLGCQINALSASSCHATKIMTSYFFFSFSRRRGMSTPWHGDSRDLHSVTGSGMGRKELKLKVAVEKALLALLAFGRG